MMYDISVKNFNNVEVFRGQNFTEELTKLALERYSTYPFVNVWESPEPENKEDFAFNTQNDERVYNCAMFIKQHCKNIERCKDCIFGKYDNSGFYCLLNEENPEWWDLKEGDDNK